MKIDNNLLLQYKNELESITQIDNALRRIETVALYFDKTITEEEGKELDALKEYAVFVECVKRPFFNILYSALKKPGTIEKVLAGIENEKLIFYIPLRNEEIWHLFWSIGLKNVTHIIDSIDMPSYTREKIILSLRNVDSDDFNEAVKEYDFGVFAKTLWRFRYILYGRTAHLEGRDLNDKLSSKQWTSGIDFSRFFLPLSEREERSVIQKSIAAMGRVPFGITNLKKIIPDDLFIDSIIKEWDYKPFYKFELWKSLIKEEKLCLPENIFVYFSDYATKARYESFVYADRILRTSLLKCDAYDKIESILYDRGIKQHLVNYTFNRLKINELL